MKYSLFAFTLAALIVFLIPQKEHKTEVSDSKGVEMVTLQSRLDIGSSAISSPSEFETKGAVTALAEIPSDEEWQVIAKHKHAVVIAQIYAGESGFGRHDVCRKRGLYNGFGWRESVTRLQTEGPVCYQDFNELVGEINDWVETRVQEGYSLAEANCYYVKGIRTDDCDTSYKLN